VETKAGGVNHTDKRLTETQKKEGKSEPRKTEFDRRKGELHPHMRGLNGRWATTKHVVTYKKKGNEEEFSPVEKGH